MKLPIHISDVDLKTRSKHVINIHAIIHYNIIFHNQPACLRIFFHQFFDNNSTLSVFLEEFVFYNMPDVLT